MVRRRGGSSPAVPAALSQSHSTRLSLIPDLPPNSCFRPWTVVHSGAPLSLEPGSCRRAAVGQSRTRNRNHPDRTRYVSLAAWRSETQARRRLQLSPSLMYA